MTERWLHWSAGAAALVFAGTLSALARQDTSGDGRSRALRASQDQILVAEEIFQGTVASVEDGDSLVVRSRSESITVHLEGIDAPEMSQAGGPEAKLFLSGLALGKTVTVRLKSVAERSGRVEIAGSDLSAAMIRSGNAWHCPRYSNDPALASAEADARGTKRGLWNLPRPTPPWLHRRAGACWQQQKAS